MAMASSERHACSGHRTLALHLKRQREMMAMLRRSETVYVSTEDQYAAPPVAGRRRRITAATRDLHAAPFLCGSPYRCSGDGSWRP